MPPRPVTTPLAPAVIAGATALLAVGAVALHVARRAPAIGLLSGQEANAFQAGIVFGVLGAAVLRDAPANRLGPMMAAAGLLTGLSAVAQEWALLASSNSWPGWAFSGWVAAFAWAPGFLLLTVLVPLLFPDGTVASRGWRWPARVAAGSAAGALLLVATTQDAFDDNDFGRVPNPLDLPVPDGPQLGIALALLAVAAGVAVAATLAVLVRMRRVPAAARPRYAWFATAVLLALVQLLPLPGVVAGVLNVLSFAALGIGVLRHGLFGIEAYLPRIVVHLALLGLALGAYFLAAAVLGREVGSGVLPALVTAVAALLLASVQGRLVLGVRRLLYGERDDPDSALTRLGDRLAATLGTSEALPASVDAVRRTLRVPYAAIRLAGEPCPAVEAGTPGRWTGLPLEHAGVTVGVLQVGLRSGERALSARDATLLARFTPHLAAVVHQIRTSRELQRSREQLVSTREQERARIHRDLHDGLGPALAGISLGLETAARAASADGDRATRLLADLHDDLDGCVEEVRRIVADLRPPVLDEGGLVAALEHRLALLVASTGGALDMAVEAPPTLDLPPAVEVAAYRIVSEAMTNAVRHAAPGSVRVSVSTCSGSLCLVVEDDGHGGAPTRLGTGLESMRLRAEELGGECVVRFREGTGTVVRARLPLTQMKVTA